MATNWFQVVCISILCAGSLGLFLFLGNKVKKDQPIHGDAFIGFAILLLITGLLVGHYAGEQDNKGTPISYAQLANGAKFVSYIPEHEKLALVETKDSWGRFRDFRLVSNVPLGYRTGENVIPF